MLHCGWRTCVRDTQNWHANFNIDFDRQKCMWTAPWKWTNDRSSNDPKKRILEYFVPKNIRENYKWLDNGWLLLHPEKEFSPPNELIQLMAVVQDKNRKVRFVMDFKELNKHVDPFTAYTDVYSKKLREWRQLGIDIATLDLRKAQVYVHKSLWPYQIVISRDQRYWLGFGLIVAPHIMRPIMAVKMSQDEIISRATSAYIDEI